MWKPCRSHSPSLWWWRDYWIDLLDLLGVIYPSLMRYSYSCNVANAVSRQAWEFIVLDHETQNSRRIYIANFAIFKIATFWSYHLHLSEKSWSFSFTKLHDFLVGSAHVWSQATVHQGGELPECMHLCMQRMQYAWGPRISIHVSKSARS